MTPRRGNDLAMLIVILLGAVVFGLVGGGGSGLEAAGAQPAPSNPVTSLDPSSPVIASPTTLPGASLVPTTGPSAPTGVRTNLPNTGGSAALVLPALALVVAGALALSLLPLVGSRPQLHAD